MINFIRSLFGKERVFFISYMAQKVTGELTKTQYGHFRITAGYNSTTEDIFNLAIEHAAKKSECDNIVLTCISEISL